MKEREFLIERKQNFFRVITHCMWNTDRTKVKGSWFPWWVYGLSDTNKVR